MKIAGRLHFTLFFLSFVFYASAQSSAGDLKTAQKMVDEEQKVFRDFLTISPLNEDIRKELQKFAVNDVNHLQSNLQYLVTTSKEKRVKGIRSLYYFMKELKQQLQEKKINEYKAPEIVRKYKQVLNELLEKKQIDRIEKDLKNTGWKSSQLLANTFWEFDEKKQMGDLSAYKRVVKTPEYIFSFLEGKPNFYYSDSLIIFLATTYPDQVLSYLQKNNNGVTSQIRNSSNAYVQQLISFSDNSLASEIAPFTEQLVNNELTIDTILVKRKKVTEYYQLLVNTAMNNERRKEEGEIPVFQNALQNALYQKALDFYVKKINELHSSPDAIRFQSVQSLRPQDLYYIIVSADEEMYTSSYLGLYKRLLKYFEKQNADSLFSLMRYDQFRKFIRVAATYNTLTDFLHRMNAEKSKQMIHLFISDIENNDEEEGISDATDIADAFISLSRDSLFNAYTKEELEQAIEKSQKNGYYQSIRLYSILQRVFDLVNNGQNSYDLSASYKSLPFSSLKDKNGFVSELILFYGDEDGKSSFNSFMNLFHDKTKWAVNKSDQWITISSLQGEPVKIFANLPLKNEDEKDLQAQQALTDSLKNTSIEPAILIHRGHSYHLPNTLKYLQPYTKLAILGSCGGYKNMKKIIDINPDVHIVASKQVGSMAVNDPLLQQLNEYLVTGKNIDWTNFWNELNEKFRNDANASKLFEEYIPPYKNVSSFVVKLYHADNGEEGTR